MGFWKRVWIAAGAAFRDRWGTRGLGGVDDLPNIPRDFDALCAKAQPKDNHVKDPMRRIVLSTITAVGVTVGVYHIALLTGASDPAVAAAAVAAFAVAAFAVAVVAAAAAVAAKEYGLQFRWLLVAYAIEALTILGALTIGSVGGSIAVACGGIGALLVFHRVYRRASTRATAPTQDAQLPDRVAAFLAGALTQERNYFLGEGSTFQQLSQRVQQARENAGRIREQVEGRIRRANEDGQQPRTYLTTASDAARDLCARLDANRDQLDAYRARVDAFFAECTAHITRIAEPLRDRTLLLELDTLLEEGDHLDRKVREVVEEETAKLAHRIAGLRDHLLRLAGDARVQNALAIPDRGERAHIKVFEDAILALDVSGDIGTRTSAATARAVQEQHS